VPAGTTEVLDAYLGDGWLFLAARIASPDTSGILAPLELHLPAMDITDLQIPFGLSAQSLPPDQGIDITLYVVSASQVAPADYDMLEVDRMAVQALSATTSNYDTVFTATLASAPEGSFVAEYSQSGFAPATSLADWLAEPEAQGNLPSDLPAAESSVQDLGDRLAEMFGGTSRLLRLRTRLTAVQLHDTGFQSVADSEISREFYVVYTGTTAEGLGGADLSGWVVLAAVASRLLRRRSRQ
jgi:hypothetical protein